MLNRMPKQVAWILLGVAACGPGVSATAAPTDIGPGAVPCKFGVTAIPAPVIGSWTASISVLYVNDSGLAVGYYYIYYGNEHAYKWSATDGLTKLTPPTGGTSAAGKVNNNGWVLVNQSGPGPLRGYVVTPENAWIPMVPPGGTGDSQVLDINDNNEVVGNVRVKPPGGPAEPITSFRWTLETGLEVIHVEPGPASGCTAINAGGTIAGWVGSAANSVGSVGYIRDPDGTITLMPPVPGGLSSMPTSISDDGVVVGFGLYTSQISSVRGFVYAGGKMLHRIDPDPPYVHSHAYDMIPGGIVVARQFKPGLGDEPALWTPSGGWFHLDALVDPKLGLDMNAIAWANRRGVFTAKGTKFVNGSNKNFALIVHPEIPPDFDCDGKVGAADLLALLEHWGVEGGYLDLNGDLVVDGADIGVMLGMWSE